MASRGNERQLETLAGFGLSALTAKTYDEVLGDACRQVMFGVTADTSKILELREDGKSFLIRAAINLKPGYVGVEIVPGDDRSAAGYAVKIDTPVISDDTATEKRFEISRVVREHKLRSLCNVPIRTRDGLYGVLEVDCLKPYAYQKEDIPYLQGFANLVGAAIERINTEAQLRDAVAERDLLLHEVHHRIKNDFQAMIALVGQVSREAAEQGQRLALDNLRSRVAALGMLHNRLYVDESLSRANLGRYLEDVARGCIDLWGLAKGSCSIFRRRTFIWRMTPPWLWD